MFQTIRILKAGGPLGLSIVGGVDHTSHPFGIHQPGVFVSKVSGLILAGQRSNVMSYSLVKGDVIFTGQR